MSSVTEPEADVVELARRLRTVAKALKHLPADHAASSIRCTICVTN